jgi:hypothetical protein
MFGRFAHPLPGGMVIVISFVHGTRLSRFSARFPLRGPQCGHE